MASKNPPIKAFLFDIGGVCVMSPLLAIEDYELKHNIPLGYVNYNIFHSAPMGAWHRLERNEMPMDATFFRDFQSDLNKEAMWLQFRIAKGLPEPHPPAPTIEGEFLFWDMMGRSREFDPYMIPAIHKLRASGKYKLGALTNNYKFPDGHPYKEDRNLRGLFDIYLSSAEIGMRKPELRIYQHACKELGIDDPASVVFVDDLGGNLKGANKAGLRTVKVPLRGTWKAVKELEELTGMKLLDVDPEKNPLKPTAKLMVGEAKL